MFFLDARSKVNLENGLERLIRSRDARYWNKSHEDATIWLATTKTPCLVIFDNADDPDMDLSPYMPAGKGKHFVITSRNPTRAILGPDSSHEVGKLDPSDSIKLLLSTCRYPDTDANRTYAGEITVALHHHSLAIVQAGGYILKNRRLSQYLSILKRKRDQLLSKKHVEQPNYPLTLYASFRLSFDQLPPITQDILWVLSFLNSTQIDEVILTRAATTGFIQAIGKIDTVSHLRDKLEFQAKSLKQLFLPNGEWDPDDFSQNTSSAIQYSLLTVTEADNDRLFYSIHPLIESFLRDTLPADKRELSGLSVRLIGSIIEFKEDAKTLAFNQRLLPHIEAISSIQSILPLDCYALAWVLYDGGIYATAERHVISALNQLAADKIPPEHPLFRLLKGLNGVIWNAMGKYDAALEVEAEAFGICRQGFGMENYFALSSMTNLVSALCSQGHYSRAAELGEQVLEIKKRVLGEEHPATLRSMSNLASMLLEQGHYSRTAEMEKQALEIKKRVLGKEHPSTLTSMGNLALALCYQGHYSRAAELQQQALDIEKRVLGEEHPNTLTSIINLALTLCKQGHSSKAAEMAERVLETRRRKQGGEHPDTLSAMNNLAFILLEQGSRSRAIKLFTQAHEGQTKVLGVDHPITLETRLALKYSTVYSQLPFFRNLTETRR